VITCQSCQEREAVVHLTQVVGEQVTTIHLCGKCAAERGIATDSEAQATPLGSFLAALGPASTTSAGEAGPSSCPDCGATLADIRASGRLGCATCWSTFAEPLRDLVRRLHGATRHVGERYDDPADAGDASERRLVHERIRLREALREAIDAEAFEHAARLRDQLRDLGGA
jgi:protein arginine kinase activator